MEDYINDFIKSVELLTGKLYEDYQHLWLFTNDEVEDAVMLEKHYGIDYSVAVDAVAVSRYYKKRGEDFRAFCDLLEELLFEQDFNDGTVSAGVFWYAYIVMINKHIKTHGHAPVGLRAMVEDAFEEGRFSESKRY